jgi:hypothetical protein
MAHELYVLFVGSCMLRRVGQGSALKQDSSPASELDQRFFKLAT